MRTCLVFLLLNPYFYIYILHFTFYTLHFTFYILHFTFYILHFTFYILRFTFTFTFAYGERELGTGDEVGQLKPSDPKKANDPRLVKITKEFGMYHGISASFNLLALCTSAAYGTLFL